MGLRDYHFESGYGKEYYHMAAAFCLPCMQNSIRYDRISGCFGNTIYTIAWTALKDFIINGGKMRIICSPCVSEDGRKALREGYSSKNNSILTESIRKEIDDLFSLDYLQSPSRALACLVAEGIIDMKFAVPGTNDDPDIMQLFHDKAGTFTDSEGNAVGFISLMNKVNKGLSSDGNLASVEVFPSWKGKRDKARLNKIQNYFDALWSKSADGVIVYDLPEAARTTLIEKSRGSSWKDLVDEISVKITKAERWQADKLLDEKLPRQYQVEALEAWTAHGRRGILEHATGSGKTYTAICAIRDALDRHESVVVLVPSIELCHQWEKELTKNLVGLLSGGFNLYPKDMCTSYALIDNNDNSRWSCIWIAVSTMDNAASKIFRTKFTQGRNLFLIADEVHMLGSQKLKNVLKIDSGARLGLSAAPVRYGDPEGTAAVMDYFGGIIPPPFTLTDAIKAGVLTPYYYTPLPISLTDSEQKEWDQQTKEINILIARYSDTPSGLAGAVKKPCVQTALIARAGIIKKASAKAPLALATIRKYYKRGQKWILYCDNKNQFIEVMSLLSHDGYDFYKYYPGMTAWNCRQTLADFSSNGGILLAIGRLDEDADISPATHALILASSINPREFLQRRGSILRRSEGKDFACLFDAVVIPGKARGEEDKSTSIIEAELARAVQFGEGAKNPSCTAELKAIAADLGMDINKVSNEGYEEDDRGLI